MNINKGNDAETLAEIQKAHHAIADLVEQLAVDIHGRLGNKQRAVTIAIAALNKTVITCLVNMATVYGQEYGPEDRKAAAAALQAAANVEIMKIIGRIPQQGN